MGSVKGDVGETFSKRVKNYRPSAEVRNVLVPEPTAKDVKVAMFFDLFLLLVVVVVMVVLLF